MTTLKKKLMDWMVKQRYWSLQCGRPGWMRMFTKGKQIVARRKLGARNQTYDGNAVLFVGRTLLLGMCCPF